MVGGFLGGVTGGATVAIVIKAVDQFSGTFSKVNKKMMAVSVAMAAVGVATAVVAKNLVVLAGRFEQTQIAFRTMIGDAQKADLVLKELADFAKKTPFTIVGIEQNAKQLIGMGIEVDKLIPTLKALGDVSAGLSVPLSRIALNFGQIKAQGKLTGRELRDFAVAGVPLIAELAKNLNTTQAEITSMVSRGIIGFDLVEEAFISMTSEGGRFFDLMDAQSRTLLGQISNIQDGFTLLGRTLGEELLPAVKPVVAKFGEFVGFMAEHPKLVKFAGGLALIVGGLIGLAGAIGVAIALWPFIAAGFTAIAVSGAPLLLFLAAAVGGMILLVQGALLAIRVLNKLGANIDAPHNIGVIIDDIKQQLRSGTEIKGAIPSGVGGKTKEPIATNDFALKGHRVVPSTGDIFNPLSFSRGEFQSDFAFKQAKRIAMLENPSQQFVINVEGDLVGLNKDEVAEALERIMVNNLNSKIST